MDMTLSKDSEETIARLENEALAVESAIGDLACRFILLACKATPVICSYQPQYCPAVKAACFLAKYWCRNESGSSLAAEAGETLSEHDFERYCKVYKLGRPMLQDLANRLKGFLRVALLALMTAADAACGLDEAALTVACSCNSAA